MLNAKMEERLNQQINAEFYSGRACLDLDLLVPAACEDQITPEIAEKIAEILASFGVEEEPS